MSSPNIVSAPAIVIFQQKNALPPTGLVNAATFVKMAIVFKITYVQLAHFLGQCHHESEGFHRLVENLNYSAKGLANTWPSRFATVPTAAIKVPNALAIKLQRNPVAIANNVYANRMGNGTEVSGDGFNHRGQGLIMITGKSNQEQFAQWIKDPKIESDPNLISQKYAFESALYFFTKNNIWLLATEMSADAITKVTLKVNGGRIGLDERKELTQHYYTLIPKSAQ